MTLKTTLALALTLALANKASAQGDLDPPAGAPSPEMRSLQEIWDALDATHDHSQSLQERTTSLATNYRRTLETNARTVEAAERTRVVLQRLAEELGRAPDWVESTVDSAGDTGKNPSLVIQSNGSPSIAYRSAASGNDNLQWAELVEGVWQLETVDTSSDDTGQYASAGLSPSGTPMVAYFNETDSSLMFAERVSGVWNSVTVDAVPASGRHCSFDHASGGFLPRPGIAYHSSRNGGSLMFTERTLFLNPPNPPNFFWNAPEVVDGSGNVGTSASLVYRFPTTPAIAYYDAGNGNLKYAERDSAGTWNISVVDAGGGELVGDKCAMAVRDDGSPVIVYQNNITATFKLAEWDGSDWRITIVSDLAFAAGQLGIALSDRGEPMITWSTLGNVNYGERVSGEWLFGTVGGSASLPDVAFLPNGRPALAWYATGPDDLVYAELRSYRFQ